MAIKNKPKAAAQKQRRRKREGLAEAMKYYHGADNSAADGWPPSRIKKLRGKLEVTQKGLADLCRISLPLVKSWENGKRKVSGLASLVLEQLERQR